MRTSTLYVESGSESELPTQRHACAFSGNENKSKKLLWFKKILYGCKWFLQTQVMGIVIFLNGTLDLHYIIKIIFTVMSVYVQDWADTYCLGSYFSLPCAPLSVISLIGLCGGGAVAASQLEFKFSLCLSGLMVRALDCQREVRGLNPPGNIAKK